MKKIISNILIIIIAIITLFFININNNKKNLDNTKKIKIIETKKNNDILLNMSLEEKIGQLLLARIPTENKIEDLKTYHLGGYILFQRDIKNKSKEEIINEIKNYQNESKIPLFIAIDEEGGTVSRLNCNDEITKEKFLSPRELYNNGGFKLIKEDALRKRNILFELGINLNLAPIADTTNDVSSFMYDRSFGNTSNETSQYIETIMSTQDNNVSYTLKHFPGYGNNTDTHTETAIDSRSLDDFKQNDFLPFITGIKNGAKFILMSHNIVSSVDDKPVSISSKWHNILRNDLNFNGIIITDDLSMGAIKSATPYIDAVIAGNNLLIVSDYKSAFNEILDAVNNNIITEELINSLITKNIEIKYKKET